MSPSAVERSVKGEREVISARPSVIDLCVCETPTACAGSAASYALRRIAYRAGAYAPHIQDAIFNELHAAEHGATIEHVDRWFARRGATLHGLGYRLELGRAHEDTAELVGWVRAGRGHRAAIVATSYEVLHPDAQVGDAIAHAVGLAVEGCEQGSDGALVMIDPWPRHGRTRGDLDPAFGLAHRARGCVALAVHWVGWR